MNLELIETHKNLEDLMSQVSNSEEAAKEFAANITERLLEANIPVIENYYPSLEQSLASLTNDGMSMTKHWWGVDLIMDETITNKIVNGLTSAGQITGPISTLFSAYCPPLAPFATAAAAGCAAACFLKKAIIQSVDNGNGVHWPMTWPQIATIVAAIPTGPAGILSAWMVFIQPFANKS